MPKAETPSFVLTLPLRPTSQDEAVLSKRMTAANSAYNALLGEYLRRAKLMRDSRAWRAAGKMPKGKDKSVAYRKLNEQYGFREYDSYAFVQCLRAGVKFHPAESKAHTNARTKGHTGYIGEHLDAHTVMAMGKRAFRAVQRAIFTRGKPRFSRRDEFRSVEGINSHSTINWTGSAVKWSGLLIPADIDTSDAVVMHGVESRTKLTRVVRMAIRGKMRWFVQLVCEGEPYRKMKHRPADGVVGLDIGPSTIAIVNKTSATLERFCDELKSTHQQVRTLQHQADRQVRAGNPECFDDRGRWIKGKRIQHRSKRMRRVRVQVAELARREQAHRKNLHGQLVHRVLSLGNEVRTEKLSYRAFQRCFGKSVGFRAPGVFVARLKAECAKWPATVTEFETYTTKLSQTCPECGAVRKKKLSQRWHSCPCGCEGQRDAISALLAANVVNGKLDKASAQKHWRAVCAPLRAMSSQVKGTTGKRFGECPPGQSRIERASHEDVCQSPIRASDAVAGRKTQARADERLVGGGTLAPTSCNADPSCHSMIRTENRHLRHPVNHVRGSPRLNPATNCGCGEAVATRGRV